jgi:hypothetical protein
MRSLRLFIDLRNYELNSVFVHSEHKYEFPDRNCLKKRPLSRYYKTHDRRMLPFLFTENIINLNVSLQRTCDSVWRSQDILWNCWERRGVRQHTWLRCLCQISRAQVYTICWYIEKARLHTQGHTHTHTNTHTHIQTKCPDCVTFHTVVFWRVCHCSNTHGVNLKPVTAFIVSSVTGSPLQTFSYTAALLW